MNKKIGVEGSLKNVKDFLEKKGYEVDTLDTPLLAFSDDTHYEEDENYYDAIVISGQSQNFMGNSRRLTESKVIDASGKTPDEVYEQIQNTLT